MDIRPEGLEKIKITTQYTFIKVSAAIIVRIYLNYFLLFV